MYTSIVLVALMGPGAAPQTQVSEVPSWQDNYTAARKLGQQENKPLAVFIGRGEKGKLTPEVQKLLAENYVCVYVNTDSPKGKRLAKEFEMEQGLVISSRNGEDQAFSHSGQISTSDLTASLRRYATDYVSISTESLQQQSQSRAETTTETDGTTVIAGYPRGRGMRSGTGGYGYVGGTVGCGTGGCGTGGVAYCGSGGCGGGARMGCGGRRGCGGRVARGCGGRRGGRCGGGRCR
jgi:hypothetical protein